MTEPLRSIRSARSSDTLGRVLFALALLLLSGCVATQDQWTNPSDPFDSFNRAMFNFNMGVDRHIGDPVALVYTSATPKPVRNGVRNFFNNLSMPFIIVNDLIQGRLGWVGEDTLRFVMNTTIGIGGIFDPATGAGLEHRRQNFGITAGVWGLGPGPYLVLPFIGPTTVTTLPDIPMRILLNPIGIIGPGIEQTTAVAAGAVSGLESRREKMRRVREAVDPYSFVKSGYMQMQWEMIQRKMDDDDAPPFEELPDDIFDDDDDAVKEHDSDADAP